MKIKFILLVLFASAQSFALQIALNWKAEPQFGGFYQAALEAKDLKIELLEGGSGTPTVQMLSFKKVDYAVVSAEEILISNEKNPKNPLVAVFAVFQTNPQAWITKADRNLNSIQEILKTPGIVSAQSGLTYALFLKDKYPQSSVTWVPYLGGITGLLKEKDYTQQGFLTSEPLLAEKQGLKVKTFLIADEGFNPYTTVLTVRKSDLNKPETKKIVEAVRAGWKNYLQNPTAANLHMSKINKSLDLETFKKSAEAQKKLIQTEKEIPLGNMTTERWQNLSDTLLKLKVLRKKPTSLPFQNL